MSQGKIIPKLSNWPFPIVNGQRTPASKLLLNTKEKLSKVSSFEKIKDFEPALF
jgi:hypothetical protein